MNIKLDRRFTTQARGVYEKYTFDVGILVDRPHYWPSYGPLNRLAKIKAPSTGTLAGGPVRKIYRGVWKGRTTNGTMASVSTSLRRRLGINFYTAPFKKKSQDVAKFTKAFFDFSAGRGQRRQVETYLLAVVRNPMIRGAYGKNSKWTAKIKGFNRLMFDTGQLFKNIQAKVNNRV